MTKSSARGVGIYLALFKAEVGAQEVTHFSLAPTGNPLEPVRPYGQVHAIFIVLASINKGQGFSE